MFSIRHFDRSVTEWRNLTLMLVYKHKWMYRRYIYKNFISFRNTIACKQAIVEISRLRSRWRAEKFCFSKCYDVKHFLLSINLKNNTRSDGVIVSSDTIALKISYFCFSKSKCIVDTLKSNSNQHKVNTYFKKLSFYLKFGKIS